MKYHITKEAAVAFRRIIFWAGVVACAVSCQDEELMPGTDTEGFIAFRVLDGNSVTLTRTASGNEYGSSLPSVSGSIPVIVGGDTIGMGFTAERNNDLIFAEKPQTLTRGASFGNGDDGKAVTAFQVTAFRDADHSTATNPYLKDEQVEVEDSDGIGRTGKYWPAGSLSFCAYAYSKENAKSLVEGLKFEKTDKGLTGSFTYSLPEAGKEEEEDKRNDPANQPDLVFAMAPDVKSVKDAPTEPVDLLFHHALSAIVFKIGTIHAERVKLKSIALENFYGKGSCEMSTQKIVSSDKTEYIGRNNVTFDWTQAGEQNNTYVLGLNSQQIQKDDDKEHWFGEEAVDGGGNKIGIEECTFMMIPQTLGENSNIVLKFFLGDDEKEYTFSKPLKDITLNDENKLTEFRADTKYIFTIGLNGDVDITVTDDVVGSEKNNLKIQNTGIANGYIRAAIVGYWADENGNAVEVWNREEEKGNFTGGLPGDGWKEGDDGFYYYQKVVPHNGYTSQLFEKYVLSEKNKNAHPNQTLILDIVGQIVIEDERDAAGWQKTFGE